jgi:hypothetical protein
MTHDLLTIKQILAIWPVRPLPDPQQIRRWVKLNQFPPASQIRPGGRGSPALFNKAAVEAWLEQTYAAVTTVEPVTKCALARDKHSPSARAAGDLVNSDMPG